MCDMRLAILALLLALGAVPPAAGQPVEPPLASRSVTFPGPEGLVLRGVLVLPPAGATLRAPVVALHGCAGIGGPDRRLALPRRERDWAQRLSALGYPVLFPDSYGSRGITEVCRGGDRQAMPEVQRRADVHAAARWALSQDWGGAGRSGGVLLLGWSHGGSTVLAAVQAPVAPGLIRAAVALYPGCRRIGEATPAFTPAAPVLMLLAAEDDWTPARFCWALAASVPAGAGPVEVVAYPGAWHGFDQPGLPVRVLGGLAGTRSGTAHMGTDPAARADALERVAAYFARQGGGQP